MESPWWTHTVRSCDYVLEVESSNSLGFTMTHIGNFIYNKQPGVPFFSPTYPPADDFGDGVMITWREGWWLLAKEKL